jgi:radical SAM protein with 4Fe4S-binding SPASM domain
MREEMTLKGFSLFHPGNLPVYSLELENKIILYTPGHVAVLTPKESKILRDIFHRRYSIFIERKYLDFAQSVEALARETVFQYETKVKAQYKPECLTITLSNFCNLSCQYCYSTSAVSKPAGKTTTRSIAAKLDAVSAAARIVAGFCKEKKQKFYLVIHGGGEPTQHVGIIKRILEAIQLITREFNLEYFSYLATNGVFSSSTAGWLAREFDLIGLSCDGPPGIQDTLRPMKSREKSSTFVERTARLLAKHGGKFAVRSTITPQTVERQEEIVDYLYNQLGATQMRFEPVYWVVNNGKTGFKPAQAKWFTHHFLAAQEKADKLDCRLLTSGARIHELHGPYCNVLKDVLYLTPDDSVSTCFLHSDRKSPGTDSWKFGNFNKKRNEFVLDTQRIDTIKRKAIEIPGYCRNCINAYHCTRNCPDICSIHEAHAVDPVDHKVMKRKKRGFRCRVQYLLARSRILQVAQTLWNKKKIQHNDLKVVPISEAR